MENTTITKSSKKRKIEAIAKKETIEKEFGLLVLYLDGDDDYGASDAESYGIEKIVDKVLKGELFHEYSFNVEPALVLFESERDRTSAINLAYKAVTYTADYDSRKHTDVHYQALTTKQLVQYRRHYIC